MILQINYKSYQPKSEQNNYFNLFSQEENNYNLNENHINNNNYVHDNNDKSEDEKTLFRRE